MSWQHKEVHWLFVTMPNVRAGQEQQPRNSTLYITHWFRNELYLHLPLLVSCTANAPRTRPRFVPSHASTGLRPSCRRREWCGEEQGPHCSSRIAVWPDGVRSHPQEVTEHIKKKAEERERQLVTSSSKYFGMPPAILQMWPRARQTLLLPLTAGLWLLFSNTNTTCTMSRTDTLLLKDSRITVGLGVHGINIFINSRKHGWKRLTEEISPGPVRAPVSGVYFSPSSSQADTLTSRKSLLMKTIKMWWLFIKCYVLACRPKPHCINTAPEEILFGAFAGTGNRKISDTSLKSWMCNTKS